MKEEIKAVVFDWGGVLMEDPSEEMYTYFANKLGVDKDQLRKAVKMNDIFIQTDEEGETELWKKVCNELGCEMPDNQDSLWHEAFKKVHLPYPKVRELAKSLRERYKTGLLSNTEKVGVMMIKNDGLEKDFDETVYSCEVGLVKPDERIYRLMLKKLGVKPEEAVFIDDKEINIDGARKVGMKGIVFLNYQQLVQELKQLGVEIPE